MRAKITALVEILATASVTRQMRSHHFIARYLVTAGDGIRRTVAPVPTHRKAENSQNNEPKLARNEPALAANGPMSRFLGRFPPGAPAAPRRFHQSIGLQSGKVCPQSSLVRLLAYQRPDFSECEGAVGTTQQRQYRLLLFCQINSRLAQ
ncbi:MAG: hypothetical protein OXI46_05600 [Gemmatimonadota bacterium]|nr:hypothetical protein [Gemmatimonadota bacterium]